MISINDFYGNRRAARSGIPLMNHIYEGLAILDDLGASHTTKRAFEIHPIFQDDENLSHYYDWLSIEEPAVAMYMMEYRNIANQSLSSIVTSDLNFKRPIQISPIPQVNEMLIADKVQNYKDFKLYHKGTHPRSDELEVYFRGWLGALGVSEQRASYLEERISGDCI